MRTLLALALFALAGCGAPSGDGCAHPGADRAVVESVTGNDASVRLPDGQPAVLHLSADVFVSEGGQCQKTGAAGLRAGDTLAFAVDAWAESYPMQGWPETAVALR